MCNPDLQLKNRSNTPREFEGLNGLTTFSNARTFFIRVGENIIPNSIFFEKLEFIVTSYKDRVATYIDLWIPVTAATEIV